jgi:hypothetical protein
MQLPESSFFDDLIALCHAVPLTKNGRFAYNWRSNIKKRDKAKRECSISSWFFENNLEIANVPECSFFGTF